MSAAPGLRCLHPCLSAGCHGYSCPEVHQGLEGPPATATPIYPQPYSTCPAPAPIFSCPAPAPSSPAQPLPHLLLPSPCPTFSWLCRASAPTRPQLEGNPTAAQVYACHSGMLVSLHPKEWPQGPPPSRLRISPTGDPPSLHSPGLWSSCCAWNQGIQYPCVGSFTPWLPGLAHGCCRLGP